MRRLWLNFPVIHVLFHFAQIQWNLCMKTNEKFLFLFRFCLRWDWMELESLSRSVTWTNWMNSLWRSLDICVFFLGVIMPVLWEVLVWSVPKKCSLKVLWSNIGPRSSWNREIMPSTSSVVLARGFSGGKPLTNSSTRLCSLLSILATSATMISLVISL